MNTKKVNLFLALVIVASMLLASCAAPTAAPTTAPAAPTTAPAAEQPTQAPAPATQAPAAPAAEPVEITYMRQADNPDIELDYVKEFEAAEP